MRVRPLPWIWFVVLVSWGAAAFFALGLASSFVMPDELAYMKQAVEFGHTLAPQTPSDPFWFNSYAQLGPLLIAPAYRLFATPVAFDVAHVIGSLAFASTAIPVERLARMVTGDRVGALLAGALSVFVPWLVLGGTIMTEVVAYPAFAWALLAIVHALDAPSLRRDLLALVAIGVAVAARTQLGLLLPCAALAAVLLGLLERRGARRAVTDHAGLIGATMLGGLLAVVSGTRSLVTGGYDNTTERHVPVGAALDAAHELLAAVAIGAGSLTLPLALAWVFGAFGREAQRATRAFAVVCVTFVAPLLVLVGAFNVAWLPGLNDRYAFYLVPILAIGAMAYLVDIRRGTLRLVAGATFAAVLLGTADLVQSGPSVVSPGQVTMTVVNGRTAQLGGWLGIDALQPAVAVAVAVVVACVALAIARARLSLRRVGLVTGVLVLLATSAQTAYTLRAVARTQSGVSADFLRLRDWVDRSGEERRTAALLGTVFDESASAQAWWDLGFWNRSVRALHRLGENDYGQRLGSRVTIDPATGRFKGVAERRLVLAAEEARFGLRSAEVVGAANGFQLVEAPRPLTAAWTLQASNDRGWLPAPSTGSLRVYGSGLLRVTIRFTTTPYAARPFTLEARGERASVTKGSEARITTTVRADGFADVRLAVRGPDGGGNGIKVLGVEVTPE